MTDIHLHRSACPNCQTKMTLARVTQGPEGFEHQSFECRRCDHSENVVVALDPTNPNTVGWLAGELGSPAAKKDNAISHTIQDGRIAKSAEPLK